MDNFVVFWGTKRDFENLLDTKIPDHETRTAFMEVVQDYNSRVRPSTFLRENERKSRFEVENLIVKANDYSSVFEHVIYNFFNILVNHDIAKVFLHNPPDEIISTLKLMDDVTIDVQFTEYKNINRPLLKDIYHELSQNIVGQIQAKHSIIASLYKACNKRENKPIILLLHGLPGVGKTETVKIISKVFGGEMLRIQFSMMQTVEAQNYIFGSEHSKICFARDLLERETNIVFIDEFDKVSPQFYNAFYQLFDEGVYSDIHYTVDAKNCIFFCATNFTAEEKAAEYMGAAMFSRFTDIIPFNMLLDSEKLIITEKIYENCISELKNDERELFEDKKILSFFIKNIKHYNDVRIIKRKLEKAVYKILTENFIFKEIGSISSNE